MKSNLILLTLVALFFISCKKDPCTKDVLGIYSGKCTSSNGQFPGKVTITQSSKGDFDVLIADQALNDGTELLKGVASEDCGSIEVPLQNLTDTDNNGYTVSGNFNIDKTKLTGELTIVVAGSGAKCSYDMTKL